MIKLTPFQHVTGSAVKVGVHFWEDTLYVCVSVFMYIHICVYMCVYMYIYILNGR